MGSLISASALSSDAETRWRMLLPVRGSVSGVAVSSMMHDGATRLSTSNVRPVRALCASSTITSGRWIISRLAKEYFTWPALGPSPNRSRSGRAVFSRVKWLSSASLCGVDVAALGLFDAQGLDGTDDDADAVAQIGGPEVVDVGDVENADAAFKGIVERLAVGVGRVLERVRGLEADGVGGHQPEDDRELLLDVAARRRADGVRRDDGLAAAGGQAQTDVGHSFKAGHAAIDRHAAVRVARHRQERGLRIVRQPGLFQVLRQHGERVLLEGFEFDGHGLLVWLRCVHGRGGFVRFDGAIYAYHMRSLLATPC